MSWQKGKLGDFLTLQRGFDLPEGKRVSGNVPIVSSSGITAYHNEARVSAPGVVTGRYGTLGQVFYLEEGFWPLNTSLYVKDFKGNSPRFISYFLRTLGIGTQEQKGAVPGVNRNVLHAIPTVFPPLATQTRIASVLSAYDDLIRVNSRRIRLLEDAARQLYQEWFVRLRFPGHEQTPVHDGLPERWERVKVGRLLTLQRGFDLPKQDRVDGENPIIAATGINGFHNEAKVLGPGVVTGRSGSLGTVLYIHEDFWPLNTTLWVKEFKRTTAIYAHHLLSELKLERFNSGAAVPTLNRNDVHDLEVVFSSEELVESFSSLLQPAYDQIRTLTIQNQKLRQARDLLLPRLMRGELLS